MSSNIFSAKRFRLLYKQHLMHNSRTLLYAMVAYAGVIFLLLSFVQMTNDKLPHDEESFISFLIGFVAVFGILFVGHSFPAFRSKESTINYLMLPGSALEKFLFELTSRFLLVFIFLPIVFWVVFHLQGIFFSLFSDVPFQMVGFEHVDKITLPENVKKMAFWFVTLVMALSFLAFVLPFTGSAMFGKQPLMKTLFSIGLIVSLYALVIYVALEPLGVAKYNTNDTLWLTPLDSGGAFRFFACLTIIGNIVMLFVAYRKIKEKEV